MKKKHRRRRNAPVRLSTGAKVAIASVLGLVGGALVAFKVADKIAGETVDDALDVVDNIRLPQPAMKMMLPETIEEFETINEVICEAGQAFIDDAPPGTTADEVIAKIRDHVLREFYPQFPWPPISGDNPTVAQLWTEVGVLVRRAVVTGDLCPEEAT